MISTKKESDIDFVKSFQKCGVKFLEKGFKCKTVYCQECNHKNDVLMQAGVDNTITVEVFRRYIDGEQTRHKL